MIAMLNGLGAEIKKTVLAPTYRKSSDGKWVNPEEMTLMLSRVKELEKGKIFPATAKTLWDYFLRYKFVDARALQQLGETLGKNPLEIDEAHVRNGFIKLPESIANFQPFPEVIRRDVTQQNKEIPAMVWALGLKRGVDLIVEVGCGRGAALPAIARLLLPKELVAIDPDPELLAIARENNKHVTDKIYPGDVRRLPFADNSVDIILDFGVLYHISHSDLGLKEIARVLKPGGKFMHETRLSQFFSHPFRVAKHGRYGRSRTIPFIAVAGILKKDKYRGLWSTMVKAGGVSIKPFWPWASMIQDAAKRKCPFPHEWFSDAKSGTNRSQSQPAANNSLPPGPKEIPGLGSTLPFRLAPHRFLLKAASKHGPISTFTMGKKRFYLVDDAELIRKILVTDADLFTRGGRELEKAKTFLGEGLITSNGAHHDAHRKILQEGFGPEFLKAYSDTIVALSQRFASGIIENKIIDLDHAMRTLTMGIVAKVFFGVDIDQEKSELGTSLALISRCAPVLMGPDWIKKLPLPVVKRVMRARKIVDNFIYDLVDRKETTGRNDFITIMKKSKMSRQEIRDEAMTLFMAGHETTASALSWSWYILSQHPKIRTKLQQSITKQGQEQQSAYDSITAVQYADWIFSEAIRKYPPVGRLGRQPLKDYQLGPYMVPAGTKIFLSPFVTHHNAKYFNDPEQVVPEHWSKENRAKLPPGSYLPYGRGDRTCIGIRLAQLMGAGVIANVSSKWEFELYPQQKIDISPWLTLQPRYGMRMIPKRRVG